MEVAEQNHPLFYLHHRQLIILSANYSQSFHHPPPSTTSCLSSSPTRLAPCHCPVSLDPQAPEAPGCMLSLCLGGSAAFPGSVPPNPGSQASLAFEALSLTAKQTFVSRQILHASNWTWAESHPGYLSYLILRPRDNDCARDDRDRIPQRHITDFASGLAIVNCLARPERCDATVLLCSSAREKRRAETYEPRARVRMLCVET